MARRQRMTLEQLQEALQNITPNAKNEIKTAITKSALLVERDAKINAPVDTGTLRNSISYTVNESGNLYNAEVGTNITYGKFQEFGTSKMPAHPFLAPAFFDNRDKIKSLISKAIENTLNSR